MSTIVVSKTVNLLRGEYLGDDPEKRIAFTVRLAEPLYERLRQESFETHRSIQEIVVGSVERHYQTAPEDGPFGRLTTAEKNVLQSTLELFRSGPEDVKRVLMATLAVALRRKK